MHTALSRGRTVLLQSSARDGILASRCLSNGRGRRASDGLSGGNDRQGVRGSSNGGGDSGITEAKKETGLSLYEQLFPDQRAPEVERQRERDLPRIPLETAALPIQTYAPLIKKERSSSRGSRGLPEQMISQNPQTSVLVLRNASKHLTTEDFRRLIPQGKHMEGWTLEQGDVLRVIPGRDLATLAQLNFYYLLFSSPLSAFAYQGHASRIHQIVASHSPSSILSPIAPPPGYMLQGMDAHAAMESFSLVPPNHKLDLRQLKPPLAPMVDSIVRHGGYRALKKREDAMPFEARLTLEGPQIHIAGVRHVLLTSAKARGLGWSGKEDEEVPRLTKWEPLRPEQAPSPSDRSLLAEKGVQSLEQTEEDQMAIDLERLNTVEQRGNEGESQAEQLSRRGAQYVYIVGFHTERAMRSFVMCWHRRPLHWEGIEPRHDEETADLPPIANVEELW